MKNKSDILITTLVESGQNKDHDVVIINDTPSCLLNNC